MFLLFVLSKKLETCFSSLTFNYRVRIKPPLRLKTPKLLIIRKTRKTHIYLSVQIISKQISLIPLTCN